MGISFKLFQSAPTKTHVLQTWNRTSTQENFLVSKLHYTTLTCNKHADLSTLVAMPSPSATVTSSTSRNQLVSSALNHVQPLLQLLAALVLTVRHWSKLNPNWIN